MPTSSTPLVGVPQLLARAKRGALEPSELQRSYGREPVSTAIGYHVYADIHVPLALSAAESDREAALSLQILAEFATLAEGAAALTGATLLEVQGERIHFLIEAPNYALAPDQETTEKLMRLARAVVSAAYVRIAPLVGERFACCLAADFGPAALLYATCGGGSVVSLGPAANRPAKRLGQTPCVAAGHLAIPKPRGGWEEFDMRHDSSAADRAVERELSRQLQEYMFVRAGRRTASAPARATRDIFDRYTREGRLTPSLLQGFCLRADLDGFSAQVQQAVDDGPEAVAALVERFRTILNFPSVFRGAIQRIADVIEFPWAGDCATLVIVPAAGESFAQSRAYLPVTAALEWHKAFGSNQAFSAAVAGAAWSLGLAAGDEHEGNEGRMLVGDLQSEDRQFRVLAGWGARRANDGYQYDGVKGGDTVLTRVDHSHLASTHADSFRPLGANFFKSPLSMLQERASRRAEVSGTGTPLVSAVGRNTPSPRPYAL